MPRKGVRGVDMECSTDGKLLVVTEHLSMLDIRRVHYPLHDDNQSISGEPELLYLTRRSETVVLFKISSITQRNTHPMSEYVVLRAAP